MMELVSINFSVKLRSLEFQISAKHYKKTIPLYHVYIMSQ